MTRRTLNGPKGIKHKVWTCRGRHEGRKGNGCKQRTVKEDLLLQTIEESIGCEVNAENAAQIQRVVITEEDIMVEKIRAQQRLRCDITINVRKSTCNLSRYRV